MQRRSMQFGDAFYLLEISAKHMRQCIFGILLYGESTAFIGSGNAKRTKNHITVGREALMGLVEVSLLIGGVCKEMKCGPVMPKIVLMRRFIIQHVTYYPVYLTCIITEPLFRSFYCLRRNTEYSDVRVP